MTGPDPFRSLDGAEPPADWDAVVARAADEPLPLESAGARGSRRPLLVAAALVLVVGLVGGILLTTRDDDGPNRTELFAGPEYGTDPEAIWGRTWRVTRFVEDGAEVPHTADADGTPIILDLGVENSVRVQVCNSFGGTAVLRGGRLRILGGATTLMGCTGQRGEMEGRVLSLLDAEPTVAINSDRLTLRTERFVVDLVDATAERPPSAPDPTVSRDPAGLWGRTWDLFGIEVDGVRQEPLPPTRGGPTNPQPRVQLDATDGDGGSDTVDLRLRGCNIHGGQGALDGDRLSWQPERKAETIVRCSSAKGVQDSLLTDTLADRPQVVVAGSELYLVTDTVVLSFLTSDPPAPPSPEPAATSTTAPVATTTPDPTTTSPPTTSSVPTSGVCTFTFAEASSGEAADRLSLDDFAPGQADPPLSPLDGQPIRLDVRHATFGDQVVEVTVPGIVVIDLVGERTEAFTIDRDGGIDATLWFRAEDGVQARVFPPGSDPCGSYTVTVAGGSEAANRDLAIRLAEQLVPAAR